MDSDGRLLYGLDQENVGRLVDMRTSQEVFQHVDWPGLVFHRQDHALLWRNTLVFGPGDLAMFGAERLVRVSNEGIVPVASRRTLPSASLWYLFRDRARGAIIDDSHAVVGARPTTNGIPLAVIDYGPARDDPMPGEPATLLAEWSIRLGFSVTKDGEIVDRR